MEWLETLFIGMFFFGLLFCAASVLLGVGHLGLGHLGHGFHFGADGAHGGAVGGHAGGHDLGHGHAGGADPSESPANPGISPFNLTALTAFTAWFGGIGYLALTGWHAVAWLSLLLAVVAGLFGWAVVILFFQKVLLRDQADLDPRDFRLEGTVGRVTVPISAGRIGEIQFTMAGTLRSEGARGVDDKSIERGTEVVIARYERGIAYVEPWSQFVEEQVPHGTEEGAA
jgi:membrane protein implicated in regulation of membrane protease activity